MHQIMCFDKNGNTIDRLVQYDTNQVLYIDWDYGNTPLFQFSNTKNDRILVVKGEIVNNATGTMVKANIPNILLTESHPIEVYVYLEQEGETIYKSIIPIDKKDKPEDYEYFENTEYISWVRLEEELEYRIDKFNADIDNALKTITSPIINVEQAYGITTITFTDANGTKKLKISGDVTVEVI